MMRRVPLASALLLVACTGAQRPPLQHVDDLEVERYLGRWHQVAAIPAWFQRQCVADTMAEYSLDPDDPSRLLVVNSCRTEGGGIDTADGVARFTAPPSEGQLEVSFVSVFGSPFWLAAGDYIVMAVDPGYRWSLVGHPSRDYAWILAREPALPDDTLRQLEASLRANGYESCRVRLTGADPERRGLPLCEL